MKNNYLDTSDSYNYFLDLSKINLELSESSKKNKASGKRYICIDLEMTEFVNGQRGFISGCTGEVIQMGAVMLDENFNMISKFSSYVKPSYSSVTSTIHELTGITNEMLEKADDFITVFDKYSYWRGEGDITTFCWSPADHKQLWNELESKGQHRYDLFACLKDFVDLQHIFGKLVSSKVSVSLESAIKLLQMDFEGQAHTAYSDSYNTARILHKLFCTESLELDFEYINPKTHKQDKTPEVKISAPNCSCSFSSFMSPELLAQFGYSSEPEVESETYEITTEVEEEVEFLADSPLAVYVDDEEINNLCAKYNISFNRWLKLATEVMGTEEMTGAE